MDAFFSELLYLCLILLILLTGIVVFMGVTRFISLAASSIAVPLLTEDHPIQPQRQSTEDQKDNPIVQEYVKRHFFQ